MVEPNGAQNRTAFTVSIDARRGITTGVSAHDRVATVQAVIAENARPEDLVRPGHVFPLRAESGGVFRRRGHTEGAVDLACIAGLEPAAVLCELMNSDGTMARGLAVTSFAGRHRFPVLSVDEIVSYREQHDPRPC
jgi:3,4-dihydroxy 2-butanone 4-phosphate synthase